MKKFLAIVLALVLVMINVAVVFAEDGDTGSGEGGNGDNPSTSFSDKVDSFAKGAGETVTASATQPTIKKTFTMEGSENALEFDETLTFTVEQDTESSYYDATRVPSTGAVVVGTNNSYELTRTGATSEFQIPITLDASKFPTAGIYDYLVTEVAGNTQGVEYTATSKPVHVRVYIEWDHTTTPSTRVATANVWVGDTVKERSKTDEITNVYKVSTLEVDKAISGNLADPTKPFTIEVYFKASNAKTAVQIEKASTSSQSAASDLTMITAEQLNAGQTVTLTLYAGDKYTFKDIPVGVDYTVKETGDITDITEAEELANVNNLNAYEITYSGTGTAANTNASTDGMSGKIQATANTATVTNRKDVTVPTGITLETLPYVLIMAIAVMGAMVLVIRKREEY